MESNKAKTWEERVRKYEEEGLTRSDAQSVVDAEDAKKSKSNKFRVECMECGKKFLTESMLPECPQCGGSDMEVA